MRRLSLLLLFFSMSFCVLATTKVIHNPSYEVKKSGISSITKIELSDTATKLTIHCTFIPHWWVRFNRSEDIIRDVETGKIYPLKEIEGAEIGEKLWMPDSGDSSVVLIYPPLEKSVKKIDYAKSIFGISLDESTAGKKIEPSVPSEVSKWLEEELAKSRHNSPIDYDTPEFFQKDTAHLVGYLKGYDVRLGFKTGIIYANNVITREDYPIVVQIYPDGRFEAEWPLSFPQYTNLSMSKQWIPFYIEPGRTLSMILDWNEFLAADRNRNIRYQFKDIEYDGPLAKINQGLKEYSFEDFDYEAFGKKTETLAPEEFRTMQMDEMRDENQRFRTYANMNKLSPQAVSIIQSEITLNKAVRMFEFLRLRSNKARKDTSNAVLNEPVPPSYYDFLKEIPLDQKNLLVSNKFGTFINRFEYCKPFTSIPSKSKRLQVKPEKSILDYLEEEGIEISDEESTLVELLYKEKKTSEDLEEMENKKDQIKNIQEKYKEEAQAYFNKYVKTNSFSISEHHKHAWQKKDSVLQSNLGLQSNLAYEIAKIRSLKYVFENSPQEKAKGYWDFLKQGVNHKYLIETGNDMLDKAFPEEEQMAYSLPDGQATDIFRKIIDPFKGKVLFVDFWATSCGPCVGSIKRMKSTREEYQGNEDFDFIFITDERGSPESRYKEFVEEQDLQNTFRISKDDHNYLRQLFKFNGIPRYVVIDEDGKVLNDDFSMHNFKHELDEILSKK